MGLIKTSRKTRPLAHTVYLIYLVKLTYLPSPCKETRTFTNFSVKINHCRMPILASELHLRNLIFKASKRLLSVRYWLV